MKSIPGTFYKKELGWIIPYKKQSYSLLVQLFGKETLVIEGPKKQNQKNQPLPADDLPETHQLALLKFTEQLMLNRYSHSTLKSYRSYFLIFLRNFVAKDPETITKGRDPALFVE